MKYETIEKIVKASGVRAGELVLVHFWGEDADKAIANRFVAAVAAMGAAPVLLQQARLINRELFSRAKETCFGERYFDLFSKFDAVPDVADRRGRGRSALRRNLYRAGRNEDERQRVLRDVLSA